MANFQWRFRLKFETRRRKKRIYQPPAQNQTPPTKVLGWDDVFPDKAFLSRLKGEALTLWDKFGGSRKSAKSFFIQKGSKPRCALELFAQKVAEEHTGSDYLGAEFWVQIRRGNYVTASDSHDDGLEFHFDKDEQAADQYDEWYHSTVSTATYIDLEDPNYPAGGLPLVIFNTRSEEDDDDDADGDVPKQMKAWVTFPVVNRHVAFDGNLLHGIPADLLPQIYDDSNNKNKRPQNTSNKGPISHAAATAATAATTTAATAYSRVSILVNVWVDHKPSGVDSLGDESGLVHKGINERGDEFDLVRLAPSKPIQAVISRVKEGANNLHFLQEHRDGDTGPLPIEELKQELNRFLDTNKGEEDRPSKQVKKRARVDSSASSSSSSILEISYVSG